MHPLLAISLVAAPATGAPIELRWDAPEACPLEAEVRTSVEALLGAPLTTPRPQRMTVIATVQARAPGWSLRIFTVTDAGTRERALRYEHDCRLLTRAAAVLIAIAVDPEVLGRLDPATLALASGTPAPPEPAPGPLAEPTPPPAPAPAPLAPPAVAAPVAPIAPPSRDPPRPRPQAGVRLVGGLGWGDLPAVGGGLGVAAALLLPRLRLEASAHAWPLRRVRLDGTAAGADFTLWTAGLRACPRVRPHARVELPLCAGIEAGQVHARGVHLLHAADERTPWFAFVLAPTLAVDVSRVVALWFAPELAVPVVRTGFRVPEVGEIHRAGAVAVRAVLGVELRFPRGRAMDRPSSGNERRARP